MKTNERNFAGKAIDMLTAIETITKSFIQYQAILETERTNFTAAYFSDLDNRINGAFALVGADKTRNQREATRKVLALSTEVAKKLSNLKVNITQIYRNDPARLTEILRTLGFTDYGSLVRSKDQEATVQFLYRFSQNLTPTLAAEFTAAGIPPAKLTDITTYTEQLRDANINQESIKSTKKVLTEIDLTTLNGLYTEVIGISKIASNIFNDKPNIKSQFTYAAILKRINHHSTTTTEATPETPTSPTE